MSDDWHSRCRGGLAVIGEPRAVRIQRLEARVRELEEALRAMLKKWGSHSGSCCTFDAVGNVIVTPESCKCDSVERAARAALPLER